MGMLSAASAVSWPEGGAALADALLPLTATLPQECMQQWHAKHKSPWFEVLAGQLMQSRQETARLDRSDATSAQAYDMPLPYQSQTGSAAPSPANVRQQMSKLSL